MLTEADDEPSGRPPAAAVHFEIEEAEPLDDAGVLDRHEGASEFVPVQPRPRGGERPSDARLSSDREHPEPAAPASAPSDAG